MKLIKTGVVFIIATILFSGPSLAGVYKCTDAEGHTSYQSSPCANETEGLVINMKTGGSTDISFKQDRINAEMTLKKKQQEEQQKLIELEENRIQSAKEQSALNQQLIKKNPRKFSPFAIPPYKADRLPNLIKSFEARLPEIEKFRRLAALKALATGKCIRVEADDLSIKSTPNKLVFSVDCSSAKTFFYNEKELENP